MRVPLAMGDRANTPRPCTGESRTSTSVEVTMGGPPLVGWDWSNAFFFALLMIPLSDSNGRLDRRMMLVIHDLKVFELIVENAGWPARDVQLRQCQRHARQLLVDLLEVVR